MCSAYLYHAVILFIKWNRVGGLYDSKMPTAHHLRPVSTQRATCGSSKQRTVRHGYRATFQVCCFEHGVKVGSCFPFITLTLEQPTSYDRVPSPLTNPFSRYIPLSKDSASLCGSILAVQSLAAVSTGLQSFSHL